MRKHEKKTGSFTNDSAIGFDTFVKKIFFIYENNLLLKGLSGEN